jgi:hypothetical protein
VADQRGDADDGPWEALGFKFGHLDRGTPEGVRDVTNTFLDGDHVRDFPDYPQGILSLTLLERYKGCDRPTFV